MRRILVSLAVTALTVPMLASTASADSSNGVGNGVVGCTLASGTHYGNPAAMLKFLTGRDGSFQTTVDRYNFGTVGNLIDVKCGG